jgi:hypothetical protein
MEKETLRKEFKIIEASFGQYKFGENDCRTFVALACNKVLDGHLMIGLSLLILFALRLSLSARDRLSSLRSYGLVDTTLLHLSLHLVQTLIDGQYFPM